MAALAGLLFSSSCTCLGLLGTAASRMFECGLALSGRSGCSPLGVLPPRFPLAACLPYGWLVRQLGGLLPFFPLPFPLESLSLHVLGRGSAEVLPSGWFPLAVFLEGVLPPLWRWRVWMVESGRPIRSSGRFLVPVCFYPLPLLRYTGSFRVPGVLVSGSGLSASACSHACGRFCGIALGPGAGFPFVSLPGGRVSDGSAPGDRFPLPWPAVFIHSVFLLRSVASALSLLGFVGFSSSSVCQFTVGRGGTFPRGNCSEFP